MIDRCLDCDAPEGYCFGDKKCKKREQAQRDEADRATVAYAYGKGMKPEEIQKAIGRGERFVYKAIKELCRAR